MHKLLAIAETLVLEKILTSTFPVSHKSKMAILLMLVSALLGAVATGFLITAFYIWAGTQFAPELAALVTAGAVFALSITVGPTALGVMQHRRHHAKLHAMSVKDDLKKTIQNAVAAFDDELGDHVRENPAIAVALASLAGYVIANRVHS